MRRRIALALAAAALALTGAPVSADPSRPAVVPDPREPWFGPALDADDTLAGYSDRLGSDVALVGRTLAAPVTDPAALDAALAEADDAGAVAVLTLEPTDLAALDLADAQTLVGQLDDALGDGDRAAGVPLVLLRWAPEMNGTWVSWGRQPAAYRRTFRQLAAAVDDAGLADRVAMLWAPAYGGGYPYGAPLAATATTLGRAPAPGPAVLRVLDTDGDGVLTIGDDPYAPYYPGDDVVDWVGLTLLRYPAPGENTIPAPSELDDRLREQVGYPRDPERPTFYTRFAARPAQPMLLVTAAATYAGRDGDPPDAVVQSWLAQVAEAAGGRPRLAATLWYEHRGTDPLSGDDADWRLARTPALGRDGLRILQTEGVALTPPTARAEPSPAASPAPSTSPGDQAAPPAGRDDGSTVRGFWLGVGSTLALVALVAALVVWIRRRRAVPTWLR